MATSNEIDAAQHAHEPHDEVLGNRLNWLRAGVLGANDGLVSVAGVVVGVAGATSSVSTILTGGIAALVAGALSMSGGEYVSVSTQRDTEQAALIKERAELATIPEIELEELTGLYERKGLSRSLAEQVARQLTQTDALRAHADAELNIDPDALTNPWTAAGASFIAFAIGGALPVLAVSIPVDGWRVLLCAFAVVIGLFLTGYVSARLGQAKPGPAIVRNVGVGILTMAITWGVGRITGGRV